MKAFLCVLILAVFGGICEAYVGHNEACDQSVSATSCDPSMNLACRGGKCECINTDDMEYDTDRSTCVVLAGGSCYKASGSNYPCVTSAYCQYQRKECVCNYQQSPTTARHCAASHGSSCDASVECNSIDLLVCAFGRCRCPNPLNHVFKEGRNRCFIKVGAPCILNPGPNDVSCDPEENSCQPDSQSMTGYSCQCIAGTHIEHYERQCVKGYLQTCEDANGDLLHPPCDVVGGLTCYEKKCQCLLSPDMAWDSNMNECAMLEGRGCALQNEDRYPFLDDYWFKCFTGLSCEAYQGHDYEGICRRNATVAYKN